MRDDMKKLMADWNMTLILSPDILQPTMSLPSTPSPSSLPPLPAVKGGGELYEERVYETVSSSASSLLVMLPKSNVNANTGVDLPLRFCDKSLPIEIKKSGAQMSGTSAYYDRASSSFTGLAKNLEDADLVLAAAKVKIPALNAYIDAAKDLEPTSAIVGMPINIKKSTRTALGRSGRKLQQAAASDFIHPISFLRDFHNKKGIYYIQIEGAGFFSLGGNPLNFPIPELEGNFKLEIRIGFAGSGGKDKVSAGYRIQGRLRTLNKSPFSLDNPEHCKHLFSRNWQV